MKKYFAELHDYDLAKIAESYLCNSTLSDETVKRVQQFYITTPITWLDDERHPINKWLDNSLIMAMAIDEMNKEVLWRFKNVALKDYFTDNKKDN